MATATTFAARLVGASRAGLAARAIRRLEQEHPSMVQALGVHGFESWRREAERLLESLEAGVGQDTRQAWLDEVIWLRRSYVARGLGDDHLLRLLTVLREVLEEDLPTQAWTEVRPVLDAGLEAAETPIAEDTSFIDMDTETGRLAGQYLVAALEGDRRKASSLILAAAQELGITSVYLEVLAAAQAEVGRLWHANQVSIAEEHAVTATTEMLLGQLYGTLEVNASLGKTVVAGAISGDLHDIGVRMAADLLEAEGFKVVFVGADVPPMDLAQAAVDFSADLVLIGATRTANIERVREAVRIIHQLKGRRIFVMVGGKAFARDTGSWARTGADGHASDGPSAVTEARRLLGVPESS